MSFEAAVHAKAIQLDHLVLDMCAAAGSGHPTSAMSLGHIVTVLMYHTMRWLPDDPQYPTSDRLVLSEGHACPIIYAAYADLGGAIGKGMDRRPMTKADLMTFRASDSPIDGHPNPMEGFPFFDAATGSLGQGLSVAAGLGLAARHDGFDKRIYCLIGDGESREGQIWEAVDFIADYQLTNVLPIFNCNGYGQADRVSKQQSPEVLAAKLEAAGFKAITIDGHEPAAIRKALDQYIAAIKGDRPTALVAKTVKGWGAPVVQGGGWHGKPPTGDKLTQAHEELKATGVGLTSTLVSDDELRIYPPADHTPAQPDIVEPMTMTEAMKKYDMAMTLKAGKFATRKAYGLALRALGHANPEVFALDADVSNSTFSEWVRNDRQLQDRFVECKIAEQNMFSVGVGLSSAGKIPFASTFAKFVTRGYDQIEMALNSGANLKICGSHAGISLAADGPSQMALPDVSWFRSLSKVRDHRGNPGCYLLQPSDAFSAYALTLAMADYKGMCYMRTFRPDVEFIYDENTVFDLGRFEVLTEGRDLLIITAGYMVHECNKSLDALDKMGIDASLVDLYSIPFDAEKLLDLANANGGNILTVEDNYGGGLGSAVADACTDSGDAFRIEQMFVHRIPKSARTEDDIMKQCGLHHTHITQKAASMVGVVNA
ncbi:MAG: transketolase [Phycisphaerales bacterium]|nr:transketolase [Phycisphaerales bacterium]MCI0632116.1 transketolase [Phycisphaerales bacterium]MCI0676665.1 transketolase [Phycisphaerales bacterium]